MNRRTKIVATVGPASESPETVKRMIAAGVDVFRLNLSHGPIDDHLGRLEIIRRAADALGRPVGVLADLPGPKIRSGTFPEGGAHLRAGSEVRLVPGDDTCTGDVISVDYPELVEDVVAGDKIILGDGAITLQVEGVEDGAVRTAVLAGGRLMGRPGVHLPADRMRLAAPTEHDLELLGVVVDAGVEFVAVSFVRGASDLETVRSASGRDVPMIVAKIETDPAVANLPEILAVADAVMVARGDLGIERPLEDVPHVQKHVIRACVEAGVPVITATQMLETMITATAPTRAEVSDIANAVFDGTDALMLSGETAIGRDPVAVVATMARVAVRAEREADYARWGNRLGRIQRRSTAAVTGMADVTANITQAVTHAAWQAASDVDAAAIVAATRSGLTARAMARYRPEARLVGVSPNDRTVRQLTLSWGVQPLKVEVCETLDDLVWNSVEVAVTAGQVGPGDLVVMLAGSPTWSDGATDVLRVVRIQ
jgi:pyruvate kinase